MGPIRRGDPGEIDSPATAVIEVEQGRAPEKPADWPIVDGQGFETGHDARDQVDEDLPFGYVAGCIDDDVVILEKACQVRCRRVCQIGLMHRDSLAKLACSFDGVRTKVETR